MLQEVDPGDLWVSYGTGTTHSVCVFQNNDITTLVLWEPQCAAKGFSRIFEDYTMSLSFLFLWKRVLHCGPGWPGTH